MVHPIQTAQKQWHWYARAAAALLVVLSITVWVYYASLTYPFEFDDLSNIVKLFKVRFATFHSLFFANSRWISYWLNAFYYSLLPEGHKFDPYLYRVGNLIIHLIAGTAVFVTTTLLQKSKCTPDIIKRVGALFPFLATALFLLHPVQTQTVSYVIQGQLEGGAGAFIFIMTSLFLIATATTIPLMRWVLLAALFITAALSCGSKEIIIVTPVLLLLIDWFFVACGVWESLKKRWWLHTIVFSIIVGLYLYLLKPDYFLNILGCKMELQSNVGNMLTETRLEKITASSFFISQFKVIVHYLTIFFWPFSMSVDYDWKLSKHFCAPDALFPFLLLLALGIYIFSRLRRNSTDLLSFCLLWFFIGILPRSSIIPSTELLADYKTYIASFGAIQKDTCQVVIPFWLSWHNPNSFAHSINCIIIFFQCSISN